MSSAGAGRQVNKMHVAQGSVLTSGGVSSVRPRRAGVDSSTNMALSSEQLPLLSIAAGSAGVLPRMGVGWRGVVGVIISSEAVEEPRSTSTLFVESSNLSAGGTRSAPLDVMLIPQDSSSFFNTHLFLTFTR